jgi:hypothetical protein
MLGIKCSKHNLYNGARLHAEECAACAVIHAVNQSTYHVPDLERIQPIKLVTEPYLGLATTKELLEEIKVRCEINGTLDYKTVDEPYK